MPNKKRTPSKSGKIVVGTDTIGRPIWIKPIDPADKLWSRVAAGPNDCIIWTGGKSNHGYGTVVVNGRKTYAHRLAYELSIGRIPDGLHLDHLCRNRACCNPWHLEPVTPTENTRRGEIAQRTHCPVGHPYDEVNTRMRAGGNGRDGKPLVKRDCRACHAAAKRKRAANRTACYAGHVLTPENTVIRGKDTRCCRICRENRAAAQSGKNNSRAKLDETQIAEIRARRSAGESRPAIAADYGVSTTTITRIAPLVTQAHTPAAQAGRDEAPEPKRKDTT